MGDYEAKPCPRCGSEAIRYSKGPDGEPSYLSCTECDMEGPHRLDGLLKAIEAWNEMPRPEGEVPRNTGAQLFRVNHSDGSEWEIEQLKDLVSASEWHGVVWCDVYGFVLGEYGELYIVDSCNGMAPIEEFGDVADDMHVEWIEGASEMATARKTHYLSIKRKFADAIFDGRKTFEVRSLRHGIEVGDLLRFQVPGCEGHPIEDREYEVAYELLGWGIDDDHACYAIMRRVMRRWFSFRFELD